MRTDQPGDIATVHARHVDIEQNQIGPDAENGGQGIMGAILGGCRVASRLFQCDLHESRKRDVVIDDQDSRLIELNSAFW